MTIVLPEGSFDSYLFVRTFFLDKKGSKKSRPELYYFSIRLKLGLQKNSLLFEGRELDEFYLFYNLIFDAADRITIRPVVAGHVSIATVEV
jgi:hypothetical protein